MEQTKESREASRIFSDELSIGYKSFAALKLALSPFIQGVILELSLRFIKSM